MKALTNKGQDTLAARSFALTWGTKWTPLFQRGAGVIYKNIRINELNRLREPQSGAEIQILDCFAPLAKTTIFKNPQKILTLLLIYMWLAIHFSIRGSGFAP